MRPSPRFHRTLIHASAVFASKLRLRPLDWMMPGCKDTPITCCPAAAHRRVTSRAKRRFASFVSPYRVHKSYVFASGGSLSNAIPSGSAAHQAPIEESITTRLGRCAVPDLCSSGSSSVVSSWWETWFVCLNERLPQGTCQRDLEANEILNRRDYAPLQLDVVLRNRERRRHDT